MNKPLSCAAQDMLEAAIVQQRRINLATRTNSGETITHAKILPIDIYTEAGQEFMTFMTTDNQGGILKLTVNTKDIDSFEANDFSDPRIQFNKSN